MRSVLLIAPLLLGADAAAAQPVAAPVQTIALYNFGFGPNPIVLTAGRAVTLAFVNKSGGSHDFTAPAFFGRSHIIAGSAPGGEIELRGGEARSVTLVPAAGRYKVHCSHAFHSMFGMHTEVVVR